MQSIVPLLFCKRFVDLREVACVNLSGVRAGESPLRPDESRAWRSLKSRGLTGPLHFQIVRQAGVPFTSSNVSVRKTRWGYGHDHALEDYCCRRQLTKEISEAEARSEQIEPAVIKAGSGIVESSPMWLGYPIALGRLDEVQSCSGARRFRLSHRF